MQLQLSCLFRCQNVRSNYQSSNVDSLTNDIKHHRHDQHLDPPKYIRQLRRRRLRRSCYHRTDDIQCREERMCTIAACGIGL